VYKIAISFSLNFIFHCSRRIIFLFILNSFNTSFKNIVQRVHEILLSESVLESIRPFIHLPRIESNGILCLSFVFIPNVFSPSEVDHSIAPILAIPPTFDFVQLPLGRECSNRTWLSEDVAFVYGSLRPRSFVETIEEGGAFLSEDAGELSKN
jgi:hypothetical protein